MSTFLPVWKRTKGTESYPCWNMRFSEAKKTPSCLVSRTSTFNGRGNPIKAYLIPISKLLPCVITEIEGEKLARLTENRWYETNQIYFSGAPQYARKGIAGENFQRSVEQYVLKRITDRWIPATQVDYTNEVRKVPPKAFKRHWDKQIEIPSSLLAMLQHDFIRVD